METETKLNFLAIIMTATAVAISYVAFTPLGGLIMTVLIAVVIWSMTEE